MFGRLLPLFSLLCLPLFAETITVQNLFLSPDSVTEIDLTPTDVTFYNVIQTASLAGDVLVTQEPGSYPIANTYLILEAGNPLIGRFNPIVLGGLPGFNFFLAYGPNTVLLRYGPLIDTTGLSGENLALADLFNTAGFGTTGQQILAGLTGDPLNQALIAVDPRTNITSRLVVGQTLFSISDTLSNHLASQHYNQILKGFKCNLCEECKWPWDGSDAWVGGHFEYGRQKGWQNLPSFDFNTQGLIVGYDHLFCYDWVFGAALSYLHSFYHLDQRLGRGDIDYFFVSPSLSKYTCNGYLESAVTFAWSEVRHQRHIRFNDFHATAHHDHSGFHIMPHFGAGYDVPLFCGVLEPFFTFDWLYNREGGYHERDSGFDFEQKRRYYSMLRGQAGVRYYQAWRKGMKEFVIREEVGYVGKSIFHMDHTNYSLVLSNDFGLPNDVLLSLFPEGQHVLTLGISGMMKCGNGFFTMLSFDTEQGPKYHSYDAEIKIGRFF